jgi:hypothetical protein
MKGIWFTIAIFGTFVTIIFLDSHEYVRATVDPIVNNMTISSTTGGQYISNIDLMEDSTTDIFFHGSVTDGDGCQDILNGGNIELTFYRSGLENLESCISNNVNCYRGSLSHGECFLLDCNSGEEIVSHYQCTLPVQYYTDATDAGIYVDDNWVGFIKVKDASQASSTIQNSVEINSLTAISFNDFINYGTMSLGATSSVQTVQIRNVGNVTSDLRVSGTNMQCSSGIIAIANQHYDVSSTSTYESSNPLSTMVQVVDINLPKYSGSPSVDDIYFQMKMPTSSVAGTCIGNNMLGAIIDN